MVVVVVMVVVVTAKVLERARTIEEQREIAGAMDLKSLRLVQVGQALVNLDKEKRTHKKSKLLSSRVK